MSESTTSLPVYSRQKNASPNTLRRLEDILKRGLDVLAAFFGMIFLSPIFVLVAVGIKRESPGPVFYKGPRTGRNGLPFKIYKFRTMREDQASYQGPRITAQDDPRVTPLGRWLRDTKLNELPQLLNILKGEMSLVGPRPEDPEIAKDWPQEVREEILSVRPGITSPASVMFHHEESLLEVHGLMNAYLDEVQPSKLRLDQLYVRHRSFLLDLDVLFWTFLVLIPRLGRFQPPEEHLFWGPLSHLGRRFFNWFVIDTLVTLVAIACSGVFWRMVAVLDIGWPRAIGFSVGFALLFSIAAAVLGINRIDWPKAAAGEALVILAPVTLSTLISVGVEHYGLIPHLPPARVIIVAGAFAFFGFVAVRYRSRIISGLALRWVSLRGDAAGALERVIIVGGGDSGLFVAWLLQSGQSAPGFQVVGFVDDDLYKQGMRIKGVEVLGKRSDIPQLVARHDVGLIIFAIHNIDSQEKKQLLEICKSTPARTVVFPDVLSVLRGMKLEMAAVDSDKKNGNGKSKPVKLSKTWQEDHLATRLELEHAIPKPSEIWLDRLAAQAEAGNLEGVKAELRALKSASESSGDQTRKPEL